MNKGALTSMHRHATPRETHAPRILAAIVLFVFTLLLSPLHAQQPKPTQGQGAEKTTPTEAEEAEDARRKALADRYGYGERELNDRVALIIYKARAAAKARALESQAKQYEDDLVLARGETRVLERQVANPSYPPEVRLDLTIQLALARAEQAREVSAAGILREDARGWLDEYTLVTEYIDALTAEDAAKRQKELEAKEAEIKRKALAESERKTAQAELDEIKAKQAAATTEQLRNLLAEQGKLAERVVKLTDQKAPLEEKLAKAAEKEKTTFAERRDELLVFLEQLPKEIKDKKKQDEVDKTFTKVRQERRTTREGFLSIHEEFAKKTRTFARSEIALAEAKERLAQAERQRDESATELGKARAELATTEVKVAQLERDIAKLELDHITERRAMLTEKLNFFEEEIELLLPKLSSSKRSEFYSLTSDRNWQEARLGLQLAIMKVSQHLSTRVASAVSIIADPLSISLWAWVGGFVWRLLLVIIALFMARTRGQGLIRKATELALKRRFFRQYPNFTIKSGEVIRNIFGPVALFASLTYMLFYVRGVLPEARFLQWAVNAAFIFRITTTIISVVILPRTVREPEKVLQGDYDEAGMTQEGVDVISIEVNRARKLVRSAKVIIWFWLIVIYVPEAVLALMGHSVIWRIVDIVTTWGFIAVIYSVLSTWKNDIARGFERLAAERLPRSVQFVNDNKDRIWGVLVIGAASIYVISVEGARLGRRYLLDTEWSKRINNFIFRKRVEMQQRDQAKKEQDHGLGDAVQLAALPTAFKDYFKDIPLTDEVFLIERQQDLAADIISHYVSWQATKKQGSIALVGESGVGKSTALFQISERLFELCDHTPTQPIAAQFIDKLTSKADVFEFMALLFDLKRVPKTKKSLIRALMKQPPRAIVLDDCHALFLRRIGGFDAIEFFLQIVNLTDGLHFWVLTFNHFSWSYLTRVKRREHYFGKVIQIAPWSESDIEELISKRTMMTGCKPNFTDLVVTRDEGEDIAFEVVKSARGYFRLLHEFCKGNPRVALLYWLRSLKPGETDDIIQVGLFKMPPPRVTQTMADNYWFALTAIAQHGKLSTSEIAEIVNTDEGFCAMALNYFEEMDIIELDCNDRASLRALYFRQVLKYLTDSNYLYD